MLDLVIHMTVNYFWGNWDIIERSG